MTKRKPPSTVGWSGFPPTAACWPRAPCSPANAATSGKRSGVGKSVLEHHPKWEDAASHHNALVAALTAQSLDEALEKGSQQLSVNPSHGVRHVREDADELRELLLGFESLGMTCEFGMVQRRFGLEPLGLLRFASIAPHNLVQLLDTDFAGVADAPDAFFIPRPEYYWLRIPSVGLQMPTMVTPTDPDAFMVQMRRRLRFLIGKLLEDLREGEKIFIYKTPHSVLGDDFVVALDAAIRRHGPGRLLCIRLPDARRPVGSVEQRPDGVFIGRLGEQVPELDVDSFVSVCKHVFAAVETQRQQTAIPA